MLVLSRKRNQEIRIAGNIIIEVLGIKGNQVRLGITAPSDVPVLREELTTRITDSNETAET
jgi:carbon storage regulator